MYYLRFCPRRVTLFDWSGLQVRRSLPIGILLFAAFTVSLWAQEEMTPENPTTGTIQGTVRDDDGFVVEGARIFYSSQATDTSGTTRTGKDGTYVSEPVGPGVYVVRVEGRDMRVVERSVTVVAGTPVTADFKTEWINPGPVRLESRFSGEASDTLPIDGPACRRWTQGFSIRARVDSNRSRSTANWDERRTTTWMKSR